MALPAPTSIRIEAIEVSELELEELDGMSLDEQRAHFVAIAERATSGQLAAFLWGDEVPSDVDETGRGVLIDAYVERRVSAIAAVGGLQAAFADVLKDL